MAKPSKKDIKAAIDRLKTPTETGGDLPSAPTPHLSEKKGNKNGIRKKGV